MDPLRSGPGGGVAVRRHDRARVPDARARADAARPGAPARRLRDGRQLRPRQAAVPRAAAGRRPGAHARRARRGGPDPGRLRALADADLRTRRRRQAGVRRQRHLPNLRRGRLPMPTTIDHTHATGTRAGAEAGLDVLLTDAAVGRRHPPLHPAARRGRGRRRGRAPPAQRRAPHPRPRDASWRASRPATPNGRPPAATGASPTRPGRRTGCCAASCRATWRSARPSTA